MSAYFPTIERLTKAAVGTLGDDRYRQHLGCEILSWLPLLRAMARVRCTTLAGAEALASLTVREALAASADSVPMGDLRPWLLGLQRMLHAKSVADAPAVPDVATASAPALGVGASWERLQVALFRLPDRQREALVLVDGAYCSEAELALVLGCGSDEARRLVRHARAALLARLEAARSAPLPSARPSRPRRPTGHHHADPRNAARGCRQGVRRRMAARSGISVDLPRDRQGFARRLNIALFWVLWQDAQAPEKRRILEQLIAEEVAAGGDWQNGAVQPTLGRASRTSWLRLMFIAFASADPASSGS